jgi:hypothetical protein
MTEVATELGEELPSREELAAEARLRAGLCEFLVTGSLRSAWYEAQRKDESLVGYFRRPGEPFKIAEDGLLERQVVLDTGERFACRLFQAVWQEQMD